MRHSLPARQSNAFSEMFLESIWTNFPSEAALLWQWVMLPAMRAECERDRRLRQWRASSSDFALRSRQDMARGVRVNPGLAKVRDFLCSRRNELGSSQTNA